MLVSCVVHTILLRNLIRSTVLKQVILIIMTILDDYNTRGHLVLPLVSLV